MAEGLPIVLVPGVILPVRWACLRYFHGVARAYRGQGRRVLEVGLPRWGAADSRARILEDAINRTFPGERVHILGHSKGAVDTRFLVGARGFGDRVASLTSIGAPHRGTPLAAKMLAFYRPGRGAFRDTLEELADPDFDSRWSEMAPVVDGVRYFSVATSIRRPAFLRTFPLLAWTHHLVHQTHGSNDGFVPESSALWGETIYSGTGDHMAQIGQPFGWGRGLRWRKVYATILKHICLVETGDLDK